MYSRVKNLTSHDEFYYKILYIVFWSNYIKDLDNTKITTRMYNRILIGGTELNWFGLMLILICLVIKMLKLD